MKLESTEILEIGFFVTSSDSCYKMMLLESLNTSLTLALRLLTSVIIFCTSYLPDIPVTVNRTTSTCQAGGIQIQGMHATVAPRRHGHTTPPTIEKYSFVPYHESNLLVDQDEILRYRDVCSSYLEQTQREVREKFAQAGMDVPDLKLTALPKTSKVAKVCSNGLQRAGRREGS